MLAELLLSAITPATSPIRRMGLVGASIGLWSRAGRRWKEWAPHEERCHAVVRRAMESLPRYRTVLVLGSGLVRDVPLSDLLARFERVVLVDAVHLPAVRLRMAFKKRVQLVTCDLSGMAEWLAGTAGSRRDPLSPFRDDETIDLVISANLLSQMPIGVERALERDARRAAILPADLPARTVQAHLDDLDAFRCRVCLLTDVEMLERDRTGAVTDRLDLLHGIALPEPDERWFWTVAPFGEEERNLEYVHTVHGYANWRAATASLRGHSSPPAAAI